MCDIQKREGGGRGNPQSSSSHLPQALEDRLVGEQAQPGRLPQPRRRRQVGPRVPTTVCLRCFPTSLQCRCDWNWITSVNPFARPTLDCFPMTPRSHTLYELTSSAAAAAAPALPTPKPARTMFPRPALAMCPPPRASSKPWDSATVSWGVVMFDVWWWLRAGEGRGKDQNPVQRPYPIRPRTHIYENTTQSNHARTYLPGRASHRRRRRARRRRWASPPSRRTHRRQRRRRRTLLLVA